MHEATLSPLVAEIERLQQELERANELIDNKLDRLEDAGVDVISLTAQLEDAKAKILALEDEVSRLERKSSCSYEWHDSSSCGNSDSRSSALLHDDERDEEQERVRMLLHDRVDHVVTLPGAARRGGVVGRRGGALGLGGDGRRQQGGRDEGQDTHVVLR